MAPLGITALITRLISLPFTIINMILSALFNYSRRTGVAGSGGAGGGGGGALSADLYHLIGRGGHSDLEGSVILDPATASQWFLRYIKTCDPDPDGQGVDGQLWFTKGGYSAALRKAKEDCTVLCVVLISKEHDDNAEFVRSSLCTPGFKRIMQEHAGEIMFWGGDVCTSRDAHLASTILQAATYPFVAFLSLQPVPASRLTGSTSIPSKMTVFSRLEGLQATSVPSIIAHINDTMSPRLNPFLGRLRAQKREREAQRLLREEQDRAYAEAGKRDLERVKAKEAEMKRQQEAEARKKAEEQMKARESINRAAWRQQVASDFGTEPDNGGTKLVIRLPDGRRLMRRFADDDRAARIWHYIDCEAAGIQVGKNSSHSKAKPDQGYKPDIAFSLATTFPRRLLKYSDLQDRSVGELIGEGILDKKVASVIVEGLSLSSGDAGSDEEEDESD